MAMDASTVSKRHDFLPELSAIERECLGAGTAMKHATTRTLYDYWSRLRGRRPAPERFEIEPGQIRHILGDTFILEAVDLQTYNFRLAGTRLCSAYCRELKGRNILDLWLGKDREAVGALLGAIV
jgi:hypothetical protein